MFGPWQNIDLLLLFYIKKLCSEKTDLKNFVFSERTYFCKSKYCL